VHRCCLSQFTPWTRIHSIISYFYSELRNSTHNSANFFRKYLWMQILFTKYIPPILFEHLFQEYPIHLFHFESFIFNLYLNNLTFSSKKKHTWWIPHLLTIRYMMYRYSKFACTHFTLRVFSQCYTISMSWLFTYDKQKEWE
jgi:hypothetical protein